MWILGGKEVKTMDELIKEIDKLIEKRLIELEKDTVAKEERNVWSAIELFSKTASYKNLKGAEYIKERMQKIYQKRRGIWTFKDENNLAIGGTFGTPVEAEAAFKKNPRNKTMIDTGLTY